MRVAGLDDDDFENSDEEYDSNYDDDNEEEEIDENDEIWVTETNTTMTDWMSHLYNVSFALLDSI